MRESFLTSCNQQVSHPEELEEEEEEEHMEVKSEQLSDEDAKSGR